MIATQSFHWWFKGKRKVIEKIIGAIDMREGSVILEIGCGTGGNIGMLSRHGSVWALEIDDYALDFATKMNRDAVIRKGWLPDGLSLVLGRKFDLVCLFDVLEHIEKDVESLCLARELLGYKSKMLITVPAYQWLFSRHDKNLGHFRRYNRGNLSRKLADSGYNVLYSGYMNMFSLPLMIASRLFDRYARKSGLSSGTRIPLGPINAALFYAFSLESLWIPRFSSPFGGSVIAVAERR
jgi:SAM-dependent methyltransferase